MRISFGGCLGMLLTPLLAIAELGVFYQGSPALGGVGLTSCPKLEETGGHRKNTPQRCAGLNTNDYREGNCIATVTATVSMSGYNQFSYILVSWLSYGILAKVCVN